MERFTVNEHGALYDREAKRYLPKAANLSVLNGLAAENARLTAERDKATAERGALLDACQRVHHWLDVKWERPLSEAEVALLLILEGAIAKAAGAAGKEQP